MGGEGHMLDMIRRLKDGKEASRLRRKRRNDKLGRFGKEKRKRQQLFRMGNAYHYGRPNRMRCPSMGFI